MSDEIPDDLLYTSEHEYLKPAGQDGVYFVGITAYAQGELGDVVFVELPKEGEDFDQGETFGTIEAVKAVSDLYTPVTGTVVETNGELDANPALVNQDPYGSGWMIKLRVENASELQGLLSAADYAKLVS